MVSSATEGGPSAAPGSPLPFRLVVITDWAIGHDALLARVEAALAAGPGIAVQHRHPGVGARAFLEEGAALATLCARFGASLFVNARLDVALALGAHLHLPAHGLRPRDVRRALPQRWLSVAVHSADEARAAPGADLALVSPVFAPGSKPLDHRPPLGPHGYARLAAELSCPAFALGGITADTLFPGLPGVAVIGGVLSAADPRAAAAALLAGLSANGVETRASTSPPALVDERPCRATPRDDPPA